MLKWLNYFRFWRPGKPKAPAHVLTDLFRMKHERFKELLDSNAELSKIIADMEEKLQGHDIFGMSYVRSQSARAVFHTLRMIKSLDELSGRKYGNLYGVLESINETIKSNLAERKQNPPEEWILPYSRITKEMVDWVGGKSANLGEVLNAVGLPIPEGFAITTLAYDYFMNSNDLVDEINKIKMEVDPDDPQTVNFVSEEIQRRIISAPVPRDLGDAILGAYDEMIERIRRRGTQGLSTEISMRSSAIGEDSELSYAGQYLSLLNVPRERIVHTYGYILASLFTPRAISYRLNKGIRDEDIAMSVACLQMVKSEASGIAYSRHPFNLLDDNVIISAVWGLGPYAVDGVITPDSYKVAKDPERTILEKQVSHKPVQLVSNPDGGLMEVSVQREKQDESCLPDDQIRLLADYAIRLEEHYGRTQDMEWARDPNGQLMVLQTRPLHTGSEADQGRAPAIPLLTRYPLLLEGGSIAFPGVGFGKAYHVRNEDDLLAFPEGGILVAKHASPKYVVVMRKAQAILTDFGSVTGHMASVAREFGVPTILDTRKATESVPQGETVTVDAYSGRVYQGEVSELLSLKAVREACMKETPVYEALQRITASIVPLNLIDPKSPRFAAEYCETLHDIMRLVHEFSYHEMFQISDLVSDDGGCAVKLDAPIPLDLYIIDLGGGLATEVAGCGKVKVEEVVSIPFSAVLRGMLHEDLRYHRPRPIELKGFFSVMTEQMFTPAYSGAERFGDRSYAIISDKYLNFSSRVGYHYSVLDSYCGRTVNKNYITFSFKGGAADDVRRNRRARAIAQVLESLDFVVEVVADRVDGKFQKFEQPIIEEKLDMIGRLLQFTRQLDMLMNSETTVAAIAKAFLSGNYHLEEEVF